ncbi:uncharacterized protein LOC8274340 [Ricinus communis]|uniref:Lipid binding protein, putative n=1 Tax=Ricinus communis TaxID=3988 RepID=B9RIH2_RICCO|nr:uncharacterized protein LOC8274340 [Ricinus communis]EEF48944.1 lipid binding protein, putative [Ricinus communis]|eukprot:XP_002513541.1 uncharacterized protein LOC8274340 [Ricinus communis]
MANTNKTHFLIIAMLVVVGIEICSNNRVVGQCESKIPNLQAQCSKFVQKPGPKIHPSEACCKAVKSVDMLCICKHITKEVENIISTEKVVYVARTCGLTLKPGTKCGSYTVPPSP